MKTLWSFAVILPALLAAPAAVGNPGDKYPFRAQYHVNTIETAELKQKLSHAVVVDVRSKYEYDTLRIKGAWHVALSETKFTDAVRRLVKDNPGKPIVFYCNGMTCKKSYDAAARCEKAGIRNSVVYDAGIEEWIRLAPELAVLLGRPVRPQDLIAEAEFERHLLSTAAFENAVQQHIGTNAIVLDIRDRIQRDTLLWPVRGEKRVPLDNRAAIEQVIEQAQREGKMLLVYDAAGDQIRWFQYYLKEKGVTNYRLMQGGAQAYFDNRYGKADSKLAASHPRPAPAGRPANFVRVRGGAVR